MDKNKLNEEFARHYMNCDVCSAEAKRVDSIGKMNASLLCRIGRRMLRKLRNQ